MAIEVDVNDNGTIDIQYGGTNASTAAEARTNLGIGTAGQLNAGNAVGEVVVVQSGNKLPALDGSDLINLPASAISGVSSVNGDSGVVVLDADDISDGVNYAIITKTEQANIANNTLHLSRVEGLDQKVIDAEAAAASAITSAISASTSEANAAASEVSASTSASNASISEANANADAAQTALDRIATSADATSTAADLVQTNLDTIATAADVVSSGSNASAAASSASAASTSETNSANSASASATSASNASTSASNAATSETNSGLNVTYSKEWAENAEDVPVSIAAGGDGSTTFSALHHSAKAAESLASKLNIVDHVYLGQFASDPAGQEGFMYYNTGDLNYRFYNGTAWVTIGSGAGGAASSAEVQEYIATEGQTSFNINYSLGFVDVFINGLRLPTSDFTATDTRAVVLNTGATLGDEVLLVGWSLASVIDGSSQFNSYERTGTATTTVISDITYIVGKLEVFNGGFKLNNGTDYTATDGSTITINNTLAGDIITVHVFGTFLASDHYTKAEIDAAYEPINADLYEKSNILGTVSESAGVPTGAIIERGSNANGEYVKYADGTLICWGTITPATNDNSGTSATFPLGFSSPPAVTANCAHIASGGVGSSYITELDNITTTTVTLKVLLHTATAILDVVGEDINFTAIGRWF